MSARVRITDNYMLDRTAFLISPREGRIYQWSVTDAPYDEGEAVVRALGDDPTVLSLPESVARALYEALGRHFGGGADAAALRKDYDAERARVDRLTDALIRSAVSGD